MTPLFPVLAAALTFAADVDPATVDRLAAESLKAWNAPGAAVAIVGPDGTIYQKGYGVKRLGAGEPVTPDTVFAIGSTTKAFTVAALGILVDEGKLNWDDPVRKHLPGFHLADPHASELVTIRDLVSHRTGLSRNDTLWYGSPWTRDEILDRISRVPLTKPFRSAWQYQNIMFLAAGQIVAKVSGSADWEEFVQRRILDPLGMANTNFTPQAAEKAADHATPHARRESSGNKVEPIAWRNIDNIGPAGSINSSVADLAKWVRVQMNSGAPILKAATLREMHTPQMAMRSEDWGRNFTDETNQMTYGMGWFLQDFRGNHIVSHGGAIDGFRAQITILPKQRQAVIVLANLGSDNMPEALRWKIVDHLLSAPSKDWDAFLIARGKAAEAAEKAAIPKRIEGTKPSHPLAAYAGDYRNDGYGIATVRANSNNSSGLELSWSSSTLKLPHYHYETFGTGANLVTFAANGRGAISTLRFQGVEFHRIPPALDGAKTAALFIKALALGKGEKVIVRYDPGYLADLTQPIETAIREAGATVAATLPYHPKGSNLAGCSDFVKTLDDSTVYLWMPLEEDKREVTGCETRALTKWLDAGGAHREIHFHWNGGSVLADGLTTAHQPEFDYIYANALDIDYAAMSRAQDQAIDKLRRGVVRVHTPAGTDITFRVGDRPFNKQDGDASAKRMTSAKVRVDREIELPAGVLRVAPIEESANGVIVVPEARFGDTVAKNVRLTFELGRVTRVTATQGLDAVEATLKEGGDAARRFREFGLGFNPKLTGAPTGSRILPYFAYGTGMVRMSLGDNEEIGGKVRGLSRRWFFFPDATVEVDGEVLSRPGR